MKHALYMLILAAVLSTHTGCAIKTSVETHDPKSQYNEYLEALKKMPVEEYFSKYWSHSSVAEGMPIISNKAEKNTLQREAILFSINFPAEMKTINLIKQSVQNDSACLLVVGETGESKKITFNVPYLLENNHWLIKEVFIHYLEDDQPLPAEPNCTPEYP